MQIKKEMAEEQQKKIEENCILEASRKSPLANGHGDECVKNSDNSDRETVNTDTVLPNGISAHQQINSCTDVEDDLQQSSHSGKEKEGPSNAMCQYPDPNISMELKDNELPKDNSSHLLAKDNKENVNFDHSNTALVEDLVNLTSVSKTRESTNESHLQVSERRISKSRSPSVKVRRSSDLS